ncbi:MAG: O-antigen polymerase [uncultured bacterium]|nr:MAG: O-antigen polymerase [uncultured bacterium]
MHTKLSLLNVLFYLCVFSLSLNQYSAIFKSGEVNVYLFDLLIAVFVVYGMLVFLIKKQLTFPKSYIFFIAFTVIAGLSLVSKVGLLEGIQLVASGMYFVRWVLYLLSGLVVFNMVKSSFISTQKLFTVFIISGLFISLAGFVQLVLLPDFETLDPVLGWDPHKNRLASTFFDPNFVGAYLTLCLVFVIEKLSVVIKAKDRNNFTPLLISSFVLITAIFLTFSRSAWLMLAVVVLIYGIFKYRLLLVLALILVFSAYFFVPRVQTRLSGTTDPADSARFRLVSWGNTWEIAKDNPLLGVGFNVFRYAQKDYGYLTVDTFENHSGAGADSSLLFILATTGVFGLATFMIGFCKNPSSNLLPLITCVSLLVDSQFINSLFYPQILFLWLIVLGISSSYSLRK